jgi:hypothetical protein
MLEKKKFTKKINRPHYFIFDKFRIQTIAFRGKEVKYSLFLGNKKTKDPRATLSGP